MIGLISFVLSVVAALLIFLIWKSNNVWDKSLSICRKIRLPKSNLLFVDSVRKVTLTFLHLISIICAGWPISKITISLLQDNNSRGVWTALEFNNGLDWIEVLIVTLLVTMYAIYIWYEGKKLNPSSEQLKKIKDAAERTDKKLDIVLRRMSNSETMDIVKELRHAINNLHVKTAYKLLEGLRNIVLKESYPDLPLLATIDYFMGNCNIYVDSKKAQEHYEEAFQTAERANYFDCDIAAGQIYVYCKKGNKDKALELAEKIKLRNYNEIWAWVPTVVFATDVSQSLQNIPEKVKDGDILIAIANMLNNDINMNLPIDMDTHPIKILNNLTTDNVPIWILYLSISLTRFLKQWRYVSESINKTPFKESEDLYAISDKYYELFNKTELVDLLPDLKFVHALVAYNHEKSVFWIDKIKTCKYTAQQKDFYYVAVASMLIDAKRESEALEFLATYGTDSSASVLLLKLFLEQNAQNIDGIVQVFQYACQYNVPFDDDHLNSILSSIQYFTEKVSPYISQLNIVNTVAKKMVQEILAFFEDRPVDIEYIKTNEGSLHLLLKPYISLIYEKYLGLDDAINVIEPIIDMNYYDIRTLIYVQLLQKDKKYGTKLYEFCKQLRKNKIETANTLCIELGMAESISDFERALQITTLWIDKNPKNCILLEHHLLALYRCDKSDDVVAFFDRLKDVDFLEIIAISNIANTYNFVNRPDLAVEFLYQQIQKKPTQSLYDLFYEFSVQKSFGDIIHQQYDIVSLNSYVMLDVDGKEKYEEILSGSNLEDLVGKHPGESIELHAFRQNSTVTVKAVFNKYYRLLRDCMEKISENRSKTIKSFTIDDLTSGDGIFANLKKLSGIDDAYIPEMEKDKENYQNGSATLYNFINEHCLMNDLYDKLFGDFTVCMIPRKIVAQNIATRNFNVKNLQPVLGLSSLLMMHEIHKQFNISFTKRFIIAKSIAVAIDDSIMKELNGLPTSFSQKIFNRLIIDQQEKYKDISPFIIKLKMLKQWIVDYCDVKICEEMLNQDLSEISTQVQRMYLESTMIANQPDRILITEDWMITRNLNSYKAMSCNNWLYFMDYKDMEKIDIFFADSNYLGCELTTEYICDQYYKNSRKEPNHLQNCYLNTEKNKLNAFNVFNAGVRLLDGFLEPGLNLFVLNLFVFMFKDMDYSFAQRILSIGLDMSNNKEFRQCLRDAYKTTHPLVM